MRHFEQLMKQEAQKDKKPSEDKGTKPLSATSLERGEDVENQDDKLEQSLIQDVSVAFVNHFLTDIQMEQHYPSLELRDGKISVKKLILRGSLTKLHKNNVSIDQNESQKNEEKVNLLLENGKINSLFLFLKDEISVDQVSYNT